jgi:hypothetical protein
VEEIPLPQEDERDVGAAESSGLGSDPVEDRLELESGTGDRSQHTADSRQGIAL